MSVFRHLLLAMAVVAGFVGLAGPSRALEAVNVIATQDAIDIGAATAISNDAGPSYQVSALAGADGIVRRIEVRSIADAPSGHWAVFALANNSDRQLDRVIVVPHFRLINSGIIWPDLGSTRIVNITPSEGFALDRVPDDSADLFEVTLNPGAVVTFVAELASPRIPQIQLWNPEAYKDRQNAFTLYKGIVIGISGLLAMFLTIVFVVRGTSLFPATAALAWAILVYVSIDFGFLNEAISIAPGSERVWRAGTEVALAAILVLFLFAYLRLNRWHSRFSLVAFAWTAGLVLLAVFAVVNPPVAAGLARLSFAATVVIGIPLIAYLGLRGFDRAIMLIPTWILLIAWLIGSAMAVQGTVDNDIVQPALSGAMVMIIVLLGFTVMQHAFAGGSSINPTLFSDVERKALAMTAAGATVWDWDVPRDRITVEPDIAPDLGLERQALNGPPRDWVPVIHPDDRERFKSTLDIIIDHKRGRIADEFRFLGRDGRPAWYALRARPVIGHDGEVVRCIGTLENVTERKQTEERMLRDAVTDRLTGLPNRDILIGQLNAALGMSAADNRLAPTLFCIDIDRFRLVNESYGAAAGDTLLIAATKRLARLLKPQDLICRLAGDSFAVILLSEQDPARIAAFAETLLKAVSAPITYGKNEITLTASIGLTTATQPGVRAADLLKDAELAMFQAKRFGGNRIEPFRPAFRAAGSDRLQIESDLRRALERGEIEMVYQPIIALEDGRLAGVEALMRWNHPRRGSVSPVEFVPVAEETGLIDALGAHALQTAATDLKRWNDNGDGIGMFVSINVSSIQLLRHDLVGTVGSVLKRTNVDPARIKLELTESMVMEDPERCGLVLRQLKDLGVGLSIDDFGTGHSSLAYVSRFPFDTMKIDRAFLIDKGQKRDTVLKTLVELGQELDMATVAEGAESEADVKLLRKLGCTYVQSFLFGAPKRAEDVFKSRGRQDAAIRA